jgi:hypothetical protein
MANHLAGAGASVTGISYLDPQGAASKERWVFGILGALEQEENNLPRIPERTDRITINLNLSTKIATINLILNVVATLDPGGQISYGATHYLSGSSFTSGTGGDSSASNLAQAAQEAVVALRLIELNPDRNLNNPQLTVIKRCQHIIAASGGTNATFAADLEFPIEVITLPGGGSVTEGKIYLN